MDDFQERRVKKQDSKIDLFYRESSTLDMDGGIDGIGLRSISATLLDEKRSKAVIQ